MKAEQELQGKEITEKSIKRAGETALREAGAIVYIGAPVDYKRRMLKALVEEAVGQALEQAKAPRKGVR